MKSVIVNGLGRCGTTWTYNSLSSKYEIGGFFKKITDIPARYETEYVFKTHDYVLDDFDFSKFDILFLFGDPRNIILSVIMTGQVDPAFFMGHCNNFYVENLNTIQPLDLIYKDHLHLEALFDHWMRRKGVLKLKYEYLFKNEKIIKEFLNKPDLDFIPVRERNQSWEHHDEFHGTNIVPSIQKTYSSLIEKWENSPEYSF